MSQSLELKELAKSFLEEHLNVQVSTLNAVSGGFISAAFAAETSQGEKYFIKGLKEASRTFEREAYGLELLASYFKVPKVMATSPQFLVLEWIDSGTEGKGSYELFGKQLARMHKEALSPNSLPGFPFDNTIGATLQINENSSLSWPDFFWENRLSPQLRWAGEKGFEFTEKEISLLQESCLDELSHVQESCISLIHGDLWGGNHKFTKEGRPWLFDPSCYYGHREAELAMMRLFSGFPGTTFEAYEEEFPLEEGHQRRLPLYQLYHVLNHVNLFGGSYYSQAKGVVKNLI